MSCSCRAQSSLKKASYSSEFGMLGQNEIRGSKPSSGSHQMHKYRNSRWISHAPAVAVSWENMRRRRPENDLAGYDQTMVQNKEEAEVLLFFCLFPSVGLEPGGSAAWCIL